jgi:non-canonical purine NTP pyrophosphatase (RdgB/HAM1 family)
MAKPLLTIVTGNEFKFQQLAHSLQEYFDCGQGIFKTYEIQGTGEEILNDKMKRAYEYFKTPILVDDTSLHLEELDGFPGPYIRDFLRHLSPYKMGKKFKGSRVTVVSKIGLMKDSNTIVIGEGVVEGIVSDPKVKDPGIREFDVFFQPDGLDRPLIEFSPEETLKYSHRGNALRDLISKLEMKNN